ncbi:MAG: diacylglycerol kinase [Deltaproteobacteria bacterium]|nr:diacylglycerol kinase [Deltaproteobacteria bacterium]
MINNDVAPLQRLVNATRNSFKGLRGAWASEAVLRYEIYCMAVALPAAWLLGHGAVERALLIGSALLIVIVEILNTAIEVTVDRVGFEHHELSGRAKDLGSAAVFCAIVLAGSVWTIVLLG